MECYVLVRLDMLIDMLIDQSSVRYVDTIHCHTKSEFSIRFGSIYRGGVAWLLGSWLT